MKAVFYNRDHSHRITPPVKFQIERYSWNMIGGPQRAYMSGELTGDEWDYMKLLRAPIEIWDEGKCLWWGYVNRVTIPAGEEQRLGLGLDELYNHVTVTYIDGDTAAASDPESVTEYGQKETRLNNSNADQTAAEQLRDIYLDGHQYARQEIEFSGGSNEISVECYGWYSTLGWKYYSTTDNTNTENTAQISAIITSSGQFLNGTIIEDISGLSSDEFRDGRSTALTYVNQLLNAGTTNILPLLAYVDRDRYLHVYERQTEPPTNQPDYLIRSDGKLVTPLGQVIPDKECKTSVWVKVRDVPDTLGGFSAMRPFYIESAEYNVSRDKTTYQAANAYEQVRLAKFVAAITTGNNTGAGGESASSIDTGGLTIDVERKYIKFYSADPSVGASGNDYLAPFSVHFSSNGSNTRFIWPSVGTWGTDGVDLVRDGNYMVLVAGRLNWSTPPTTGSVTMAIRRNRGGSVSTIQNFYFDASLALNDGVYGYTIAVPIKQLAADAIGVYVFNGTDQSVAVGGGYIYLEYLNNVTKILY